MSQDAATLADITSADWSLKLGEIGAVVQGVADVDQCIAIILTTPKGSDPLRPTFGADIWSYIDYPIDEALPAIVREITAAITAWEPRVRLLSVSAAPVLDSAGQAGAQLTITVVWQLKLASPPAAPSRTQVVIPPAPL
jgi:Bacteriophage baseplate protein W